MKSRSSCLVVAVGIGALLAHVARCEAPAASPAGVAPAAAAAQFTADEALRQVTVALRAQRGSAELWHRRAELRRDLGDMGGALADLAEAIRLDPFHVNYLAARAALLAQRADWIGVLADTTAALAVDPRHPALLTLRARARAHLGQLPAALGDADAAVALKPDDVAGRRTRAWIRLFQSDWAGAAEDARAGLAQAPDDPDLLLHLGLACRELRQRTEARAAFARLVSVQPKHGLALFNLGRLDLADGQWASAAERFTAVLDLSPGLREALVARGRARLELNEVEEAGQDFEQALAREPADAEAHLGRALVAEQTGDYAAASAHGARAVELGLKNERSLLLLARTSEREGEWEAMLVFVDEVLKTHPGHPGALRLRARSQLARKQVEPALASYAAALDADPRDWRLRLERAGVLSELNRPADCARDCDVVLAARPDTVQALALRAHSRLILGRRDEARADCERALALGARQPLPLLVHARILLADGRAAEAVTECAQALKAAPGLAWGYSTLALALLAQNNAEAAAEAAARAVQHAPNDAESHATRGRALAALRRDRSATESLRRAIELDPSLTDSLAPELEKIKQRE